MDIKEDIQKQAIAIAKADWKKWDSAEANITEKISFNMRNVIRQCRKNYAGVFDVEKDPHTGKTKLWIPLSESSVESVVKNIDLDTKNIETIAKKPSATKTNAVIKGALRNFFDKIGFGEFLNDLTRKLSIDGTVIVKVTETKDEEGKIVPDIRFVDPLNFYIEPTAKNIQETDRVMERVLMTPSEIKQQKGWLNTEDIKGSDNLNPNDPNASGESTTDYVDVWEVWGLIPRNLITGGEDESLIEGHIILSGLEGKAGEERVHLIEENKKKLLGTNKIVRPYEECQYTKFPGRWYGKGVVEKLLTIQAWINTIINIRINRAYVSQLGLFKIKKNSGITQQMISRLATNGAIKVNAMDDVEQMVMQEVGQASYKDEEVAQGWARQVTQAYESVTGEQMPASMPATNAAIQSRSAQSSFSLIRENVGLFLERLIKRQILPIFIKNMTNREVVMITGEGTELDQLDETVSALEARRVSVENAGFEMVDENKINELKGAAKDLLKAQGNNRYFKDFDYDVTEYDVKVNVSNEDIDTSIMLPNLINALAVAPEYREPLLKKAFDILGIEVGSAKPQMPQMPQAQAPVNPNQAFTQANTI